uniref:Uncharacterized protein n=1 Tax=Branchiostoma floridae TaxID=7739 RepID=C3Y1Y0_BRAFL|eukprot:XP_002609860.1 hypothetical protein BRAFLDRAFT_90776 [Branchiostoma floridae]
MAASSTDARMESANSPSNVQAVEKDDTDNGKDLGIVSKRLSRKVRKRMAARAAGKKSAASRGIGRLSRSSRTLELVPVGFKEDVRDYNHPSRPSQRTVWSSPAGSKYRTDTLRRKLKDKGMSVDDIDSPVSATTSQSLTEEGNVVSSARRLAFPNVQNNTQETESIVCEDGYYVGQICQVQKFVNDVTGIVRCRTEGCNGMLIPRQCVKVGLGGGLRIVYSCSGCSMPGINFDSSTYVESSRRHQVSLALCLAMLVSGNTYAGYNKVLGQALGLETLNKKNFQTVIHAVYPITRKLVHEHCEAAKTEMRDLPAEELGSAKRAVTQADGTWGTRGFHSKNCTVTVRNSMNNSLLYVAHLCMKGKDKVADEDFPLYKGTSKSGEGVGLEMLWEQAVRDGISPEVHWQDGDSSSALSFRAHFPDEKKHKVMLCSGHVARSHQKALSDLKPKKTVSKVYRSKHQEKFPQINSVKCVCEGKSHGKGCGCMTDAFIRQARINFFCCVVQADKDPDALKDRLQALGKYHGRNIHSWKETKTKKKIKKTCDFHPQKTCTCEKCKKKGKGEEPVCGRGKPYTSKSSISCPLHSLMYEIETARRAEQAHDIIHPELGRGNSNLPEASHNVLIRLRSKDVFLSRLHYIVKTDMGLLQSCVSWEQASLPFGPDFKHWTVELFKRMKLPIPPGMLRNVEKALVERNKDLERAKTDRKKAQRIALKVARVLDSEERKKWVKQRNIQHSYGSAEAADDSEDEATAGEDDARNVLTSDSQPIRGKKSNKVVGRVVGLSTRAPQQTRGRKRKSPRKEQPSRRKSKKAKRQN